MPGSVSGLCLEEYFIDVAHKFTKPQRQTVQLLIMSLKRLNRRLPELNEGPTVSICTYANIVINLANMAIDVISECENFIHGVITEYSDEEIYEVAGLTENFIQALVSLQNNATINNSLLSLNTNGD